LQQQRAAIGGKHNCKQVRTCATSTPPPPPLLLLLRTPPLVLLLPLLSNKQSTVRTLSTSAY
jgi:hypothetical protein